MAIERYKLIYSNSGNSLTKILEITDGSGVVRSTPIVHQPTDGDWASFLSSIAACSSANLEVVQSCLFDDTTHDYLNLVPFVRYSTLEITTGDVNYLGDYQHTASGIYPYTVVGSPVSSVGDQVTGSQCRRTTLSGTGSWALSSYPLAFRVEINVISGTPTLSDAADNVSSLYPGEKISFESNGDGAGLLTDDLTISAGAGQLVTINWTELKT